MATTFQTAVLLLELLVLHSLPTAAQPTAFLKLVPGQLKSCAAYSTLGDLSTIQACKDAAAELKLTDSSNNVLTPIPADTTARPYGCVLDTTYRSAGNQLYFNKNRLSTIDCAGTNQCVCGKADPCTITDGSAANVPGTTCTCGSTFCYGKKLICYLSPREDGIFTGSCRSEDPGRFGYFLHRANDGTTCDGSSVSSGSVGSGGTMTLRTKEQCQLAATRMGIEATVVETSYGEEYPTGCSISYGFAIAGSRNILLRYNPYRNPQSKSQCGEKTDWQHQTGSSVKACICLSFSKTCSNTDGTVADSLVAMAGVVVSDCLCRSKTTTFPSKTTCTAATGKCEFFVVLSCVFVFNYVLTH